MTRPRAVELLEDDSFKQWFLDQNEPVGDDDFIIIDDDIYFVGDVETSHEEWKELDK